MIKLIIGKLRAFRPTPMSLVLLVIATIRMFTGGGAIWLVGVCAGVVPFICQFRRYPARPEDISEARDTTANYLVNLVYMVIYLVWVLTATCIGSMVWPGYEQNPALAEQMLLAICSDMVFISCVYMVGHKLAVWQRLGLGIVLCNGQLGFMLLVSNGLGGVGSDMLFSCCIAFIALIFALTLAFIRLGSE